MGRPHGLLPVALCASLLLAPGCGDGTAEGADGGVRDAGMDAADPGDGGGDAGDDGGLDAGDDGGRDAGDDGAVPADGAAPDGGACPLPDGGLVATFSVVGQIYRAQITNAQGIEGAIALWQGESTASIPNGDLVCEPAPYNCGYTWHQDPATIQFADFTIEVCDGTPAYIEANCDQFVSNYCPWSAELIDLRDCRTDPTCPRVSLTP